ncbi:C-C motif chemokine 27a [Amphiprion ocellaris]|uniref:Chemokine interleukin-8-like domain-containing protein n=1 Tax=Amphiprion ocellaris TaxID=80972 RepID=A0AAQ5Y9S9_AMPOC|nr:C-C motif chemokine 27a [Amphiprion ocellaris]
MDLKIVLVVVCLYALVITFTEGIPKCCIKTKNIPRKALLKVERFEMQTSSGACDIPALVLYLKNQRNPICAHPKMKAPMMILLHRMKQSRQKSK